MDNQIINTLKLNRDLMLTEYNKNCPKLRFGKGVVPISKLDTEFYCEQLLEYRNNKQVQEQVIKIKNKDIKNDIEDNLIKEIEYREEKLDRGREIHENIKESINGIKEFMVFGQYKDVGLLGSIDELVVEDNKIIIIENKSKKDSVVLDKPYGSNEAQARGYCYCVKCMIDGYDNQTILFDNDKYNIFFDIRYFDRNDINQENIACNFNYKYDINQWRRGLGELDFALPYWKGQRIAKPSNMEFTNKHISCEFRDYCKYWIEYKGSK